MLRTLRLSRHPCGLLKLPSDSLVIETLRPENSHDDHGVVMTLSQDSIFFKSEYASLEILMKF